jgi:hypothetical protein
MDEILLGEARPGRLALLCNVCSKRADRGNCDKEQDAGQVDRKGYLQPYLFRGGFSGVMFGHVLAPFSQGYPLIICLTRTRYKAREVGKCGADFF